MLITILSVLLGIYVLGFIFFLKDINKSCMSGLTIIAAFVWPYIALKMFIEFLKRMSS